MSCIPPHVIAEADQRNARRNEQLTFLVDNFRAHVAIHDGDTLCARWSIELLGGMGNPAVLAELLAAAVARIARDVPGTVTRTP